ncbi:MAG TPA: type II toxin-antitoxin system RelE/ParE family toxin [Candidatus Limnocylindrales bacterium]|nr:type II toxin-antitoxin system RelE/ParE family toxin [Candidatus Limnocylindrales bacterium]
MSSAQFPAATWSGLFHDGTIYATITHVLNIREYQDRAGDSPFREWFDELNSEAARKITIAVYRLGLGNLSNIKSIGAGVHECRINFGPGYRVYFGREGEQIVILLGGGTKKRQQNDIRLAIERWQEYKRMKKQQKEE